MALKEPQLYAECDVCGTVSGGLGWRLPFARQKLKDLGWFVYRATNSDYTETTCPECITVKTEVD